MTKIRYIKVVLKTGEERLFEYEKFGCKINQDMVCIFKESNKQTVLVTFPGNVWYVNFDCYIEEEAEEE